MTLIMYTFLSSNFCLSVVVFFLIAEISSMGLRNIVSVAYRTSLVFNIRELLRFNANDLLKISLNGCLDLNVGVLNIWTSDSGLTISIY